MEIHLLLSECLHIISQAHNLLNKICSIPLLRQIYFHNALEGKDLNQNSWAPWNSVLEQKVRKKNAPAFNPQLSHLFCHLWLYPTSGGAPHSCMSDSIYVPAHSFPLTSLKYKSDHVCDVAHPQRNWTLKQSHRALEAGSGPLGRDSEAPRTDACLGGERLGLQVAMLHQSQELQQQG